MGDMKQNILKSSVSDPFHFDMDPDPFRGIIIFLQIMICFVINEVNLYVRSTKVRKNV